MTERRPESTVDAGGAAGYERAMDDAFVTRVGELAAAIQGCPVDDPAAARSWLDEHVPFDGEQVATLRAAAEAGARRGASIVPRWACDP